MRCAGVTGVLLLLLVASATTASARETRRRQLPPSPYAILGSKLLEPPALEAVPICVPARLSLQMGDFEKLVGEGDFGDAQEALEAYSEVVAIQEPAERVRDLALLRAVLASRAASERAEQLDAKRQLENITKREKETDRLVCALLESARLAIALRLLPEADAALSRIRGQLSWLGAGHPSLEAAKFFSAELLYRRGDAFNAHVGYRELASSSNPRMAAAARLRLTDLSFDAGKSRSVQLEYETLLPHGQAFGAHMTDWSLRVVEAALDAGNYDAAQAWLERFAVEVEDRDARDIVEVRWADLDVLRGGPGKARTRLRSLWRRKGDVDVETLARIRQIDLGVSSDPADKRIAVLHTATSSQNRGVRVYALAVLAHELLQQGKLDEGAGALTRLAYEGAPPVLARHFGRDLGALLERSRHEAVGDEGCGRVIRRLGGRYGVLLQHTSDSAPFMALGACFEHMKLERLAISLYRTLARTYGSKVANDVALPLARASLAAGDASLARAAAQVNIRHGGAQVPEWKALLAGAEATLSHDEAARDLLRELLQGNKLPDQQVSLAFSFGRLIAAHPFKEAGDTKLLERVLYSVPESHRASSASEFGQASMLVAARLRAAGQPTRAGTFYSLASEYLPDGARRDEARYWATGFGSAKREQAGDVPSEERSGPWLRLTQYEAKASVLTNRYSLGSQP